MVCLFTYDVGPEVSLVIVLSTMILSYRWKTVSVSVENTFAFLYSFFLRGEVKCRLMLVKYVHVTVGISESFYLLSFFSVRHPWANGAAYFTDNDTYLEWK